jgi:lipoate-protein ligase A
MTVSVVHRFLSSDPLENLAREELLLDALPAGASALVLYVNRPCVVLGKHQNPLREVRLDEAFRRGVPVVRRVSGGGTVWHDEGNLNWSYLGPKEGYDRSEVTDTVSRALGSLGFDLEAGEKGDLFWTGKKVSGAAYLFRRDRVMHHGTLLCQARLEDLHGLLGPTGTLGDWVGVASRPAPVTNLGIGVETAAEALAAVWGPGGPRNQVLAGQTPVTDADVARRARQLADRDWLWDQTPPFTWEGTTRLGPGRFEVTAGRIEAAGPLSAGVSERDDRSSNMSKIVGKRFFDPEILEYIPTREVL